MLSKLGSFATVHLGNVGYVVGRDLFVAGHLVCANLTNMGRTSGVIQRSYSGKFSPLQKGGCQFLSAPPFVICIPSH